MTNDTIPQEIWDHEIVAKNEPPTDWLWHGLVAGGNSTILTGMWKGGKTTLLSLLLAQRKHGGTLAGLAVKPGKTVVVTEEGSTHWAERLRHYDFGGQVCFFSRPFLGIPRPHEWRALIGRILELQAQHGIDLAVLDPLAPLLPCENNARCIFDAILPLRALTLRGVGILSLHHPAKGAAAQGQAARGSGALLGHVDISIEMRHPGGDPLTRRRRLLALSRFSQTPRQLLLELNPEATDYVAVPDDHEDGFLANWEVLRMVFEDAEQKLTRGDIHAEWPADFDKPCLTALRKYLERAVPLGLVACEGTGRKNDPFRYWFPQREAYWRENSPLYDDMEELRKRQNLPFVSLRERKRGERDDYGPRPSFDDEGDES
jgi:hypothetical protein